MEELKRLRELRQAAWEQAQTILVDARGEDGFTAERQAAFDKANADISKFDKQIDAEETLRNAERATAEVVEEVAERADATPETYMDAFGVWLRKGEQGMTAEQREIFERAQVTFVPELGGVTVPEMFVNRLTKEMESYGGLMSLVETVRTSDGRQMSWLSAGTAAKGRILAETTPVVDTDVFLGQRTLGAYTYTSDQVNVSRQLLTDSAFDIVGYLAQHLAERIDRIWNEHITTGSGVNEPEGLLTGATDTGTPTAVGGDASYNDILALIHSVDPAYRRNGTLMFSDDVLLGLRQLTDGDGRPLWNPSIVPGVESSIAGVNYVVNYEMADRGNAGEAAVAFGDFRRGYMMRVVDGVEIITHDLKVESLQKSWFAVARMDGRVNDANAFRVLLQG